MPGLNVTSISFFLWEIKNFIDYFSISKNINFFVYNLIN